MSGLKAVAIDPALADWCRQWLGAKPLKLLFEGGNLSGVAGLELSNGRQVVVKIRPPAARIAGCIAVQRHLFAAGFHVLLINEAGRTFQGPGSSQ